MSHHGHPPTLVSFLIGGMTGVALAALLIPRPFGSPAARLVRARARRLGRSAAGHRSRALPEPALATGRSARRGRA